MWVYNIYIHIYLSIYIYIYITIKSISPPPPPPHRIHGSCVARALEVGLTGFFGACNACIRWVGSGLIRLRVRHDLSPLDRGCGLGSQQRSRWGMFCRYPERITVSAGHALHMPWKSGSPASLARAMRVSVGSETKTCAILSTPKIYTYREGGCSRFCLGLFFSPAL
jgi:hypothetical protein